MLARDKAVALLRVVRARLQALAKVAALLAPLADNRLGKVLAPGQAQLAAKVAHMPVVAELVVAQLTSMEAVQPTGRAPARAQAPQDQARPQPVVVAAVAQAHQATVDNHLPQDRVQALALATATESLPQAVVPVQVLEHHRQTATALLRPAEAAQVQAKALIATGHTQLQHRVEVALARLLHRLEATPHHLARAQVQATARATDSLLLVPQVLVQAKVLVLPLQMATVLLKEAVAAPGLA